MLAFLLYALCKNAPKNVVICICLSDFVILYAQMPITDGDWINHKMP